jgi:predicted protein tyrosine phosphatase
MRDLIISDLHRILSDTARLRPDFVLSLIDPEEPAPALGLGDRHAVLRCLDLEDADGPGPEIVAAIHAFADRVPDAARVIVHCHAGVSRSPAAALMLLARWGQPLALPIAEAMPNARLLALADPSGRLAAIGAALTAAAEANTVRNPWG